jgi:TRAP-type mannitol/chloroaromatic compound transport system substrate-binding protein
MLAKYDNGNPAALRRLVASGTKLLPFPTAVLEACFNATNEVCNEIVTKNPKFKKVWESWKPYRSEQVLWSRIAEGGFDGFMARMYGAGKV